MPTGYTVKIEDDPDYDFPSFLWDCVGAFDMRSRNGEAITLEVVADVSYELEGISHCQAELEALLAMSPKEIVKWAENEHNARKAQWEVYALHDRTLRTRYAAMRQKVENWKPPTDQHRRLREFMLEQIGISTPHAEYPFEAEKISVMYETCIARFRERIKSYGDDIIRKTQRAKEQSDWLLAIHAQTPRPEKP